MAAGQEGDRSREMFGELRLVDEVVIGKKDSAHEFVESEPGVCEVQDVLGRPTRVIPNTGEKARYFSYRLGKGKGLRANGAYVLQVEYPEDAPRTMFVHNRGAETQRGLHTGPTAGDVLHGKYVDSNIESLKYPLSGKHEAYQNLFYLQDRFAFKLPRGGPPVPRDLGPDDGIPVIISQLRARNAPLSQGAAVSRIALYEVVDPAALKLAINYPPDGLPRRHLFWREEMSDGVVAGLTMDAAELRAIHVR
jgi:hypothetical protein